MTYNVHSLSHLHEDVTRYGQLENFSCFILENYLGKLKSKIRGKYRPLEQINNRLSEIESISPDDKIVTNTCTPIFITNINNSYFICKKLKFNNILISIKKIYIINSIFHLNGMYKIICTSYRYMNDFYVIPIKSSKLGTYFARGKNNNQMVFSVSEISCKYIAISHKDGFYLSPIIHRLIF